MEYPCPLRRRRLPTVAALAVLALSLLGCNGGAKEGLDSFYTRKSLDKTPIMPLIKPVRMYYDEFEIGWWIDMTDYEFGHLFNIYDQDSIGVEGGYIHGNLKPEDFHISNYKKTNYYFFRKYGSISISPEFSEPREGYEVRVYPSDSTGRYLMLPERWYVLDVGNTKIEAFFSREKYRRYLEKKGVSGKMYDIRLYHRQYRETGILPWFPDSVKQKILDGK